MDERKIISGGEAGPVEENALLRASIMDLRQRLAEFEQGSGSDALTGLPNRGRLLVELERVVASAGRYGTPAALLYVELDNLEAINERHGPLAGDAALVEVAGLLAGLIRSTDIAARIGDNAFALVLDHLDTNSAIETSERIARCIAVASNGAEVSIAVAAILKGDSAEEALERAEANLRRLKEDV